MTIRHHILTALIGTSLLTSCMTSQKWVDDDVYVVKSVEIPTDTDISDEADYNAFVYNQRNHQFRSTYYSSFMLVPYWRSPYYWNTPYYTHGGWGADYGWGFGSPYYDPFGFNYGYGYGYNPYCGYYNPFYCPWGGYGYGYYGNNGYYGNGYGNYNGPNYTSGLHVSGPRGTVSGYGGVRYTSPGTVKSTTAGTGVTKPTVQPARTVSKPVNAYDHVGRTGGVIANSGSSSGRTISSGSTGTIQRPSGTTTTVRPATERVPRPTTNTSGRTINSGSGTYSPSGNPRNNNGGSYNGSGNPRPSSGGSISSPRSGGGTSGSSGVSRSGGGSSGGGTKTVGRR